MRASSAVGVGSLSTTSFSGLEFRAWVASLALPDFQSLAVGVGNPRTSVSKLGLAGPVRPCPPPCCVPYEAAVGVGREEKDSLSVVRRPVLRGSR